MKYLSELNIDGKEIKAFANVWEHHDPVTVDMFIEENGEMVWRNKVTIYSLTDAATTIRMLYKAKGKRIKWMPSLYA